MKEATNDAVLSELHRIADENPNGELVAQEVVDAARALESPLHEHFEWDDSAAAEQWRLDQARALIRVTVTVIKAKNKAPMTVHAFWSLTPDRRKPGGGYRAVEKIMASRLLRKQLLADALAELEAIRSKYAMLSELADIFEEVDKLAKRKEVKTAKPKRQLALA